MGSGFFGSGEAIFEFDAAHRAKKWLKHGTKSRSQNLTELLGQNTEPLNGFYMIRNPFAPVGAKQGTVHRRRVASPQWDGKGSRAFGLGNAEDQ